MKQSQHIFKFIYALIAFILLIGLPPIALGQEIVIVKSDDIAPYRAAVKGFKSTINAEVNEFVLDKRSDKRAKRKFIKKDKKNRNLIFTLGTDAFAAARANHPDTPIVFTFILNPDSALQKAVNNSYSKVAGITMTIPPHIQFKTLLEADSSIKRIGVVYDPSKTGKLIKKAKLAAKKLGLELIDKQIRTRGESINAIDEMQGRVDAIWMVPDTTAITRESSEYMLFFSIKYNVPLIGISEKYVKNGALFAYSFDSEDMGKQAGELARKILGGEKVRSDSFYDPRTFRLSMNLNIARKLGINVPKQLVRKADKVY